MREAKTVGYGAPANSVRDPHHDGVCYWRVQDGKLYHIHAGATRWVEVKRVSYTPARILAIASLLRAPSEGTREPGEDDWTWEEASDELREIERRGDCRPAPPIQGEEKP